MSNFNHSLPTASRSWLGFFRMIGRSRRAFVTVLVCLAALLVAWQQIEVDTLRAAVMRMSVVPTAIAFAMLTAGALISSLRLRSIAADVGAGLTVRDAIIAMSLGQVAGALSVQFFGQIAARSAFLAPRGFTLPANVAIAIYERFVAVTVCASLAIAGAWVLFGHIVLDLDSGGRQFLHIVFGVTAAALSGAIFGWGRRTLLFLKPLWNRRMLKAVGRIAVLTLAIQATTATAYVVIAHSLAPEINLFQLVAASLVVMFAASLPISFAGWGIREISAIFALNAIGVPTPAALLTAVLVGILALLATAVLGAAAAATPQRIGRDEHALTLSETPPLDFAALLAWVIPVAAATAIFFQIHIPTGRGQLNVNLADPLAILGGAVFAWTLASGRYRYPWRLSHLAWHAGLATAVILAAFAYGWISFGWTEWAFFNKLVGWFILLCYFGCGALIVGAAQTQGLMTLLRTFVASGAAIVLFDLIGAGVKLIDPDYLLTQGHIQIVGFAQNRNAFSFQLLLLMAATIVAFRGTAIFVLLTIIGLGIYFSGSRAGFGGLIVIAGTLVCFLRMPRSVVVKSIIVAAGSICAAAVAAKMIAMSVSGADAFQPWSFNNDYDANVRWQSLSDGLAMFLQSPLVGAGLGAFMNANGGTLQIHSTPIWLLAETGLIGLIIFATPAIRLFVASWREGRADPIAAMTVSVLLAFALMSSVHEMMYQRVLWLLLGAAAVRTVIAAPPPAADGH